MDEINEKKKEYELLIHLNNEIPNLNTVKIIGIQTKKLDKLTYVMYILMELADYDWEKEIKRRTKNKLYYNEDELINILKSVIDTFSLLQTKGISHRDVKPQNILCFINKNENNKNNKFDNNNNKILYKIADFGEAKTKEKKRLEEQKSIEELYQNDTNKQTIKGTELYMSPILFKAYRTYPYIGNVQYNAFKNDVFSLGLTFLFASTLTFQSLYEIREVYDMEKIKNNVKKYLNGKYSKKFIECILFMIEIDEKKRPDFIEMDSWIKKNYDN
jgi:serine/threonine protein kinase